MLIPSTNESQPKISLSNQRSDFGFRKHSAFKVNLRPRLPLAYVNTKLMEQQRPNTKESNLHEFAIEDDSDRNSNTFNEAESYIESLIATKHRFRPSTVLKKNKFSEDRSGLPSSRSSSSKSISLYNRNKNITFYQEISKSLSPVIMNRKEIKNFQNDHYLVGRKKSQLCKEVLENEDQLKESSVSDLLSPKTKTELTSFSNGTNCSKSKLDLFKEIYEHVQNKDKKNQFESRFQSKRYSLENMNLNDDKLESLIKNLNEEEFMSLLKDYRKTQEINLDSVMSKFKKNTEKFKLNSKSSAKIINLKGEFEPCSTFSNIYTRSGNKFPVLEKKNQFISRQNSNYLINQNRLPNYFINYLNNKILIRAPSQSYLSNKNVDSSNNRYSNDLDKTEIKNDYDITQTISEPSPSIQQEDNIDSQKFQQQLKILNIPTTAN